MSDETSNQRSGSPFWDLEPKWQEHWQKNNTFKAVDFSEKPKYYVLDMFPYPSGAGLHVGHPEGYTATDIMARYKWARGFNVLHPMGFDSFGLPAEQYALQTGTHPAETTANNIETFRRQLKSFGFAIDWDREIATSNVDYYKWTQWIFLQLYKKGLAYQSEQPVNWCPELGTVLSNEEVIDGKSERGGHPVVRRPMRQWVLKITEYADRLLEDLDQVDWPNGTLQMQKNWIGRSTGANVIFSIEGHDHNLEVYTTRPDTLFGATYMVLSPEHPLVPVITTSEQRKAVDTYVTEAARKSDLERTDLAKGKTGVFTGCSAINPVNGARIPVWVADYVLISYGTGAIMAVPAHDSRDLEFAQTFNLPVIEVVENPEGDNIGFTGEGTSINSGDFTGLSTEACQARITDWLEEQKLGKAAVNYKLRDWLFSRQRYWGEPFPLLLKEDGSEVPVPEEDLPVALPDVENYHPNKEGEPPLANASEEWLLQTDPQTGETLRRETNTMPQWAGSCWYYLRYLDPHNSDQAWDPEKEKYWMPVDLYVGGAEHAVRHLLYARFWHKVLYDEGHVSTPEPFTKLIHQGMILGEDSQKMSKSRGNVVNPDDVLKDIGADAFRIYEMFMGPLEDVKPWQTSGLKGTKRFLDRIWNLYQDTPDTAPSESLKRSFHKVVKKVTEDIERMRFNTAIAIMMEFVNEANKEGLCRELAEPFAKLLAPFAPHLAEELWERLGHEPSIAHAGWPEWDEALCTEDMVTYVVQIKGKVRDRFEAPKAMDKEALEKVAREREAVQKWLDGHTVRKVVVVPGKLVSFVI